MACCVSPTTAGFHDLWPHPRQWPRVHSGSHGTVPCRASGPGRLAASNRPLDCLCQLESWRS